MRGVRDEGRDRVGRSARRAIVRVAPPRARATGETRWRREEDAHDWAPASCTRPALHAGAERVSTVAMRPSRGGVLRVVRAVEVAVLPAGPMDRNVAPIWMGPAACFHFQRGGPPRRREGFTPTGAGRDAGAGEIRAAHGAAPRGGRDGRCHLARVWDRHHRERALVRGPQRLPRSRAIRCPRTRRRKRRAGASGRRGSCGSNLSTTSTRSGTFC